MMATLAFNELIKIYFAVKPVTIVWIGGIWVPFFVNVERYPNILD